MKRPLEKVIFSWSGGKDSAFALYKTLANERYEIRALITTLTEDYDRTCMHGIRRLLVEQQAQALGVPLEKVFISKNCSNEEYEEKMRGILLKHKKTGVSSVVFGDIFLEDLKKDREDKLSGIGLKALFPLWKKDTRALAREFLDAGFKAIITSVDTKSLDGSFSGRLFDESLLADLPASVDPCGENGEFHSFVYAGPIFKSAIPYKKGERVLRDNRFSFCDLLPESF